MGREHRCILYFRDVFEKIVQEYWQETKFRRPHNENVIETLLAYLMTAHKKYTERQKLLPCRPYCYYHVPHRVEWHHYLHRIETLSHTVKGIFLKRIAPLILQERYCAKILDGLFLTNEDRSFTHAASI